MVLASRARVVAVSVAVSQRSCSRTSWVGVKPRSPKSTSDFFCMEQPGNMQNSSWFGEEGGLFRLGIGQSESVEEMGS